jgi:arginyl-tRNA synthetase
VNETIRQIIISALKTQDIPSEMIAEGSFVVEHPADLSKGDYSSNAALVFAKVLGKNPVEFAQSMVDHIKLEPSSSIAKVEVAGPGFINFFLSPVFFEAKIKEIVEQGNAFGKGGTEQGKKVAVEYTDPNPFKQFHIGHLMTNIIGESLARLFEWNGAEVKRFCYQGDVGRHVALTIWGFRFMDRPFPEDSTSLNEKVKFLGESYALASQKIKDIPDFEAEIQEINKKVYDRSDAEVNEVYDKGREWSLEHFEEIYAILGTKFDQYFFESVTSPVGKAIVEAHTPDVFRQSEGAIIFPGEDFDLHTRVFITKNGLTTYEAKEMGLAKLKYDTYPYDLGITITAHEQSDYFKVVLKALSFIFPEIASKSQHISHGMLRFASGKMSSRTGNVITGESLLNDMIDSAYEKVKDRLLEESEKKEIAQKVAVAALKYWILKQSIGKDIIFDKDKALSLEGDSGPYLQYAHTRALSVLRKAKEQGIEIDVDGHLPLPEVDLVRKLYRFSEVVEESLILRAPQQLVTFLTDLASTFNSFYATTPIVTSNDSSSGKKVALVAAFAQVMKNGLTILGIPIPERM